MTQQAPADPLARVLRDPRVVAVHDIFERHDRTSMSAQGRFRQFSAIFIAATAVASLAAALILFGSGAGDNAQGQRLAQIFAEPALRNLLFGIEISALAVAAFATHMQESRQHSNAWVEQRRAAEACRIEEFETVLAVAEETDPASLPAAFDHFVTGLLDGQLAYFATAGDRHDSRSGRLAIATAVVASVVAVAGATGFAENWFPLAALAGVAAPVVMTALNSWRDAGNDLEKAGRYNEIWVTLRRIRGRTGVVRDELAGGNPAPMKDLVAEVTGLLRAENEGWTAVGKG